MSKEKVDEIKKQYPVSTRIQLTYMDDMQSIPSGTMGTVEYVDDQGQLQMKWDNGRRLALIPNVDRSVIVQEKVQAQDQETTNMEEHEVDLVAFLYL